MHSPPPSPSVTSSTALSHTLRPSTPPPLSALIFPIASHNIAHTSALLSARSLSIRNRLHSIDSDAEFVRSVAAARPGCAVVSNERCGGWYVDSRLRGRSWEDWMREEELAEEEQEKVVEGEEEVHSSQRQRKQREAWGSAYFKSTDGHTGEWSFSPRRLNLQLFEVIGAYGGYVHFPI